MTFRFLNETRRLKNDSWAVEGAPALWIYNLHYFDDLNAANAGMRRGWHIAAIQRWIDQNPPGIGDAWAPYPTSLRIVNWIKWILAGGTADAKLLESLALQARTVRQRLERHLLGNHLFSNAKALVMSGLFFCGAEAESWLRKGMAVLDRQFPEQILPDGGHFERSPMYHALALEDILDLINVASTFPGAIPKKWSSLVDSWPTTAARMFSWLSTMCHPDGEISFFNDAAIGIAPSPRELLRYAGELADVQVERPQISRSTSLSHLVESGYVRAEVPNAALLTDVAPLGPDYLPGHGHADTLSFELSVFGHRVIVNGGTSRYESGAERDAERGTAAHSTVAVDGKNSSEVWSGFRVARRAKPFDVHVRRLGEELSISAAHDGYCRLSGRPVHRRAWTMRAGSLCIDDAVVGGRLSAIARYHLHPSVSPILTGNGSGQLRLPEDRLVSWRASGGAVTLEPSKYAPQFGRVDASACICVRFEAGQQVRFELSW